MRRGVYGSGEGDFDFNILISFVQYEMTADRNEMLTNIRSRACLSLVEKNTRATIAASFTNMLTPVRRSSLVFLRGSLC